MDIWHRLGKIFRFSNLGTLIFFLLNTALLLFIFYPNGITPENAILLLCCYLITVLISLSPVGEWMLAIMAGAREIKRTDIKIKLIPLMEMVLSRAKQQSPDITDHIKLKMIRDKSVNAFAIGRKTICVTEGLMALSDDEIMAVLAHETGHLVYKHSAIQLLIGGGNLFITGFLLIIKLICWMITGIFTIISLSSSRVIPGILIIIIGSLSSVAIWVWTKFCMLFLMWSMRQNEYVADEYALRLGFGNTLTRVWDRQMCSPPDNGLLKALYSSHPHSDDRIARLQELGATYSRW